MANIKQKDLIADLKSEGVPYSEIESMKSLFEKEETKQMDLVGQTQNHSYVKFPLHFSQLDTCDAFDPPALGQHNREVLLELGYSVAEIDRLASMKII